MGRADFEILPQRVGAFQAGDIEQHAAAQNRSHAIHRVPQKAAAVRLRRRGLIAAVEFAAAGKMAEGIDVGADVGAQSQGVGGRRVSDRPDVFPVLLDQAE